MSASGTETQWLTWARRLQALSQTGIAYSKDPYHLERFEAIRDLAAEITAKGTGVEFAKAIDLFSMQSGYATPKVDTRGFVFREGRILMVNVKSFPARRFPGLKPRTLVFSRRMSYPSFPRRVPLPRKSLGCSSI
jgi:hypothetical protein